MYDYIIVGGGSSGCVLANRLSANPANKVCLVEAGPDDSNPLVHVPFGVIALVRGWFANWKFWSEPQQHMHGRRTYQPRGKVLGGCSSINAMVCTRGHAWDYDHWASLGCAGWSYAEVLPYFRKSESYQAPLAERDRPMHGFDGPLKVSERRYTNPLSEVFVEAGQQAGHARNDDFNGADQEGVGQYKVFQDQGRRCSNARAYLTPEVRQRPNLSILTDSHATKLLLEGKRATGVRIARNGASEDLKAAKEVILSAGAFQSPQLLMLSGIGPRAELEKHGIAVVQDLPGVGQNLQDHLEVIVQTRDRSRTGLSMHPTSLLRTLWALLLFIFRGTGSFTSNGPEAGGFIRSTPQEPRPDLQWHFAAIANVSHGFNLTPMLTGYAYITFIYDMRPLSRGRVGLYSADPLAPPLIDPNYLAEPADVAKLVQGVRLTRQMLAQPAFEPHRDVEQSPGASLQSDAELSDWVRRTAETTYHPVGTCKMGTDALAVVDAQLRVHGMQGLRVADASIMPTLVGSNTNAPSSMIGEKAADLILQG